MFEDSISSNGVHLKIYGSSFIISETKTLIMRDRGLAPAGGVVTREIIYILCYSFILNNTAKCKMKKLSTREKKWTVPKNV